MQETNNKQHSAESSQLFDEINELKRENKKLEKINDALIYRMEEGSRQNYAYHAFEHAVNLSEKVNKQTEQLNRALQELESRNHELAVAHELTQKTQLRLNDAVESSQQPMVLIDSNKNLSFFNTKFSEIWQGSIVQPKMGDDFYEVIQLAKMSGVITRAFPHAGENMMVYQFANSIWYQVSENTTQDAGRIIVFNDITEVKLRETNKHERVVRQKNQILQSLIDNIKVGILRVKKSGELEVWNNTFINYSGLSNTQLLSCKTLSKLSDMLSQNGLKLNQDESSVQHVREDLILEREVSLINDALLFTFKDITSQYQYAESLRENERWIRLITDNIPALIAYIGPEREFQYTNKAYRDWYGISQSEFQNLPIEKSHLRDVFPRLKSYLSRASNGEVVEFSSEEVNANGESGMLQKVYLPHIDSNGDVIGHFVLATDITEQIKSQNDLLFAKQGLEKRVKERTEKLNEINTALHEAVENKTKFIAALSHDLLQPLSAAILFNESLKNRSTGKEAMLVNSLDNSLSDLEALIRTLIDISKLDAGLMQPHITSVVCNPMLDQLANEFSELSKNFGVDFRFKFQQIHAQTDTTLLARMLRNILSNALKYGAQGKVLFVARQLGEEVLFMILDQGFGITAQEQLLIFKEFERLPNNRNYEQSLGLGLSIVDKMAKLLEHKVEVRSQKHKGSCFVVRAPRANPTVNNEIPDTKDTIIFNEFSGANIWHIDNDLSIRLATQALFESWGMELESYASFKQCLMVNNNSLENCDAMLLDYHLDENENGLLIAKDLRKTYPKLAIILCTANHSKSLEKQAKSMHVPIVYKPIDQLKLRQTLNMQLVVKTSTQAE